MLLSSSFADDKLGRSAIIFAMVCSPWLYCRYVPPHKKVKKNGAVDVTNTMQTDVGDPRQSQAPARPPLKQRSSELLDSSFNVRRRIVGKKVFNDDV